jgi:hypothetical protein
MAKDITEATEVILRPSFRELVDQLELAVKIGGDLEGAANALLAHLKLDTYEVKWRKETFDGLHEYSSQYLENIEVKLRQGIPQDCTGVWLYRHCGHCKNRELIGASHGVSRRAGVTNVKEVLDIFEQVRDL